MSVRITSLAFAGVLAFAVAARGENAIRPGRAEADPPTLVCLGVHWPYRGDDDRDAAVRVRYRVERAATWRRGLDLFRIRPEHVLRDKYTPPDLTRAFAGSIFDLEPDTAYEVELTLTDPDGGSTTAIVRSRTRPVPRVGRHLKTRRVTPETFPSALKSARPAQVLLLAPGVYKGNFHTSVKATAHDPFVIRGESAEDVTLDGKGAGTILSACDSAHVYIENVTFWNGREGVRAHGARGTVVRGCKFFGLGHGFRSTVSDRPGRDFYIADNVFIGPCSWPAEGIEEEEAIEVIGTGHVVCHNTIIGFGDAISVFRTPAVSIDFYNNDIDVGTDDGIEMDYSQRNTRCFRNRITNARIAISLQPIYGGPCYVFRNETYNTSYGPLKLHNRPSGAIIAHNTSIKQGAPLPVLPAVPISDVVFRNNLFIGDGDRLVNWHAPAIDCDFDYNGYGPTTGIVKIGGTKYASLREAARAGYERHGRLVAGPYFESAVAIPAKNSDRATPVDCAPHPQCAAIDAGAPLANVNDGFAGRAPDLGARERGAPPPLFGPRR